MPSRRMTQTFDDLTRMVRLHGVNGDPLYREYLDEILAIRNDEALIPFGCKILQSPHRGRVLAASLFLAALLLSASMHHESCLHRGG